MMNQPDEPLDEVLLAYRTYRQAPKRRLTWETIGWSLGMAVMAYMLLAGIAGIIYAG
jgi:hypothetical protein